jgi:molecular chaperone GrpE (heat shock protein)
MMTTFFNDCLTPNAFNAHSDPCAPELQDAWPYQDQDEQGHNSHQPPPSAHEDDKAHHSTHKHDQSEKEDDAQQQNALHLATADDEDRQKDTALYQRVEALTQALADAQNLCKRLQREKDEAGRYGITSFAGSLVVVADTLSMALNSIPRPNPGNGQGSGQDTGQNNLQNVKAPANQGAQTSGSFFPTNQPCENLSNPEEASCGGQQVDPKIQALAKGVQMTLDELFRIFESFGIVPLRPAGQIFDPHFHQVCDQREQSGQPSGTILEVLQEGYKIHDRLLRPAMVIVAT